MVPCTEFVVGVTRKLAIDFLRKMSIQDKFPEWNNPIDVLDLWDLRPRVLDKELHLRNFFGPVVSVVCSPVPWSMTTLQHVS